MTGYAFPFLFLCISFESVFVCVWLTSRVIEVCIFREWKKGRESEKLRLVLFVTRIGGGGQRKFYYLFSFLTSIFSECVIDWLKEKRYSQICVKWLSLETHTYAHYILYTRTSIVIYACVFYLAWERMSGWERKTKHTLCKGARSNYNLFWYVCISS